MITKHLESMDLDLTINGDEVIIDELSLENYPKISIWRTHKFTRDILLQIETTLENLYIPTQEQDKYFNNIIPVWHKRYKKIGKADISAEELMKCGFTYISEHQGYKIYIRRYPEIICIDFINDKGKVDFHIPLDTWSEILTFIKQDA